MSEEARPVDDAAGIGEGVFLALGLDGEEDEDLYVIKMCCVWFLRSPPRNSGTS